MLPNTDELIRIVLSTIVPTESGAGIVPVPVGKLQAPITVENYSKLSNLDNLFLAKSIFIDSEASIESGVFQKWENYKNDKLAPIEEPVFRIYQFIVLREKSNIIDTLKGDVPPVAVYSHLGHDQNTAFGGIAVREIYRVEFFGRPYQTAHRAYLLARAAFVKHSRISVLQGNIDDYDSDIRIWRKFLTISIR